MRNAGVNQTVNMFTFKGLDKTVGPNYGKAKYEWVGLKTTDGVADPFQPDNILSRWQVQFGLRYTFCFAGIRITNAPPAFVARGVSFGYRPSCLFREI